MRLHVGCGARRLPGYVGVDVRRTPAVDVVWDARAPFHAGVGVTNESVDEVYHCALLEHLTLAEVRVTLHNFHRVLRPGGVLRSSVPDFEAIAEAYLTDGFPLDKLRGLLYGRGNYPENVHRTMFDRETFTRLLTDAGFVDVADYDWRDFLPEGYDDFSRAYLPHLDFERGRQMMLNVTARKP